VAHQNKEKWFLTTFGKPTRNALQPKFLVVQPYLCSSANWVRSDNFLTHMVYSLVWVSKTHGIEK
jgi:hypothetical protein